MFIYYRDGALDKALWEEVERTMRLCGTRSIKQIDASLLVRQLME